MKAVTFKSSWRSFFAGDTASFEDDVAQQLVDGDVADWFGKKKTSARTAENKVAATGPVIDPPPGGGDGDDDEPKP